MTSDNKKIKTEKTHTFQGMIPESSKNEMRNDKYAPVDRVAVESMEKIDKNKSFKAILKNKKST